MPSTSEEIGHSPALHKIGEYTTDLNHTGFTGTIAQTCYHHSAITPATWPDKGIVVLSAENLDVVITGTWDRLHSCRHR